MAREIDIILDTRGEFCPVPVIKAADAMKGLRAGQVVIVISDDPAIEYDLPAWCRSAGHEIVVSRREGREFHYSVRKSERAG